MKNIFTLLLCFLVIACSPTKPALSVSETNIYPVKGRQGLLINQKLSFGDYKTSAVKRSWTRSGNTRVDLISGAVTDPSYPNLIAMNYADSDQSFYFKITDYLGNAADVYAVSQFHSEDLQIGDNPNSVVNILEDIFGGSGFSEDLFYLQVFLQDETTPWQLVLDNDAAQMFAGEYTGFFALSNEDFYTLQPITNVNSKKGTSKLLAGSIRDRWWPEW